MKYPIAQPNIPARATEELLLDCVQRNWFTTGPKVRRFEELLAERLGVPADHVVTTTSGTTALHLALAALGIGPGDEVIVPDLTYVATVNAVKYVGATPVLVDVDPQTWCINPERVAEEMTARTKAIIPVHLYGQACDMDALRVIASDWHGVPIIEDAAEGFGGAHRRRALGTHGHIGCFSFFGNKLITTGEGGACVAWTLALAAKLRSLGSMCNGPIRYLHTGVGFNYRMTDLQAAVGIPQLEQLDSSLHRRHEVFSRYRARLKRCVSWPHDRPAVAIFAPWLFTCELPARINREMVMMRLAEDGIETRPTFVPMHEMFVPMHEMFGAHDDFPVTERLSRQGISLPTYTALTDADVDFICDALIDAIEEQR